MSFMQFQQRCEDCGKEWNAAFGIVGTTYIAQPPTECPHCKSERIIKIADEWKWDPPPMTTFDGLPHPPAAKR